MAAASAATAQFEYDDFSHEEPGPPPAAAPAPSVEECDNGDDEFVWQDAPAAELEGCPAAQGAFYDLSTSLGADRAERLSRGRPLFDATPFDFALKSEDDRRGRPRFRKLAWLLDECVRPMVSAPVDAQDRAEQKLSLYSMHLRYLAALHSLRAHLVGATVASDLDGVEPPRTREDLAASEAAIVAARKWAVVLSESLMRRYRLAEARLIERAHQLVSMLVEGVMPAHNRLVAAVSNASHVPGLPEYYMALSAVLGSAKDDSGVQEAMTRLGQAEESLRSYLKKREVERQRAADLRQEWSDVLDPPMLVPEFVAVPRRASKVVDSGDRGPDEEALDAQGLADKTDDELRDLLRSLERRLEESDSRLRQALEDRERHRAEKDLLGVQVEDLVAILNRTSKQ